MGNHKERDEIIDAGEGIHFAAEALLALAERLRCVPLPVKVVQVRDLTGSSRRYATAALRWLCECELVPAFSFP